MGSQYVYSIRSLISLLEKDMENTELQQIRNISNTTLIHFSGKYASKNINGSKEYLQIKKKEQGGKDSQFWDSNQESKDS